MPVTYGHPPTSLSSFLASVEEIKRSELGAGNKSDFIFRGQRTDEPLIPRLARLKPKGKLPEIEQLMMADFDRQQPPFAEFEPRDWDRYKHGNVGTRIEQFVQLGTAPVRR